MFLLVTCFICFYSSHVSYVSIRHVSYVSISLRVLSVSHASLHYCVVSVLEASSRRRSEPLLGPGFSFWGELSLCLFLSLFPFLSRPVSLLFFFPSFFIFSSTEGGFVWEMRRMCSSCLHVLFLSECISYISVCVCVYVCVHVHVRACVRVHLRVCVCMCVSVCACAFACACACPCACVSVCVCVWGESRRFREWHQRERDVGDGGERRRGSVFWSQGVTMVMGAGPHTQTHKAKRHFHRLIE